MCVASLRREAISEDRGQELRWEPRAGCDVWVPSWSHADDLPCGARVTELPARGVFGDRSRPVEVD